MNDQTDAVRYAGQLTRYASRDTWVSEGERLAYTAAHLPLRIGEWYDDGVRQFGAAAVIQAIAAARADLDTGGKSQYPYLAQVKLHTVQSYASVARAIRTDERLRDYDFWHVEAVLGVPDVGKRLELLNAGKVENMSVARFRRYRDEEMGKLAPPPPDSVARLNGRVVELTQANRELADAVGGYAALQREYDAIQAQAAARAADYEPPAMTYPRGEDHSQEWVTGRLVCPSCGGVLVCKDCGEVMG